MKKLQTNLVEILENFSIRVFFPPVFWKKIYSKREKNYKQTRKILEFYFHKIRIFFYCLFTKKKKKMIQKIIRKG